MYMPYIYILKDEAGALYRSLKTSTSISNIRWCFIAWSNKTK